MLRRLGKHSHENRLYRAFRELGRVIRTVTPLRFLSEPELRGQITAITNKAEAFHGYAEWLMIGVADLLVEDELACYRPNPAHQRAKLLEVTPTGRAALHRMQAAYTQLALRTTEGLDSDRLDLARETLSELQRRLESELP
ncbi:transposase [Saccharopolyspora shandongensis]|uniref:transposase n=1 Tax=Saccharopolyspora shandongensis TaxID=418495 RepID=UPI001FE6148F|nr:transposase [Saccharopolyspora shandongensis]